MTNPKVHIEGYLLGDGAYKAGNKGWDITTLTEATKGLEVFDLQLAAIDLDIEVWGHATVMHYLYHMQRINNCNYDYPVILSPSGFIIDGWHRVAKAILDGKTEIKAVRLLQMPEPTKVYKE